ncbi:HD-GYP domain-containing protein [uncultured Devosia sp.]|uniref:HD-GYP domain-containing protein n=1 Tax=uncultured Devosia sp. TaxID=211434 RepID=UPI0035CA1948
MSAVQDAQTINLSEVVGALSFALDITEGQPVGHSLRCCWIGMHIGMQMRLSPAELSDLYYTLLLKDIGCSSNAARICKLYLTDDLDFKRGFKSVDDSLPQILRFVLANTGTRSGLADRFRAMINIARNGGEIARELIETRCQRGADIARQMRFSAQVQRGILDLDEHWSGKGQPLGLIGETISLYARIALLAQVIDIFHTQAGRSAAIAEIKLRTGIWFDPHLVAMFEATSQKPGFWSTLHAPTLSAAVVALEPAALARHVDEDYLDDIAAGFAQVIDAKSPFTSGHSDRVALFSDMIAEGLGVTPQRRRWLKRAALLHDIGKLGVSNSVLDKPGPLDVDEWAAVKQHPAMGEAILSRIAVFRDMATIAGTHHERLDGKGYPRGIAGMALGLETRIVTTADIFDALTADRPYRGPMPVSKALEIMEEGRGLSLDPACLDALKRGIVLLEHVAA